jgi:hypothetical protein
MEVAIGSGFVNERRNAIFYTISDLKAPQHQRGIGQIRLKKAIPPPDD